MAMVGSSILVIGCATPSSDAPADPAAGVVGSEAAAPVQRDVARLPKRRSQRSDDCALSLDYLIVVVDGTRPANRQVADTG
jgi:hypothetical protein